MNLWLVLIAIALIVASGLLIAAETAMTRVSKTRIDELRKEGNGNEKRAELLVPAAVEPHEAPVRLLRPGGGPRPRP